jgi:branched-chain amino acid transport system permease protein
VSATSSGPQDVVRSSHVTGVTRWSASTRVGTPVTAVVIVLLAAGPFLVGPSQLFPLVNLFAYVMLALTWNLLAGYGGMVSVGQQAYIGLGAYGLVYLAGTVGLNGFLAVPLAAVAAAVVSVPVSFLAFRLTGGYFAVGTWVVAEVLRLVTVQIDALGAGSGTSITSMSGYDRDVRIALTYWVALAATVLVFVGSILLVRSRFGLALGAVRDDPTAAASSGVAVSSAKRVVFVLAAGGAGLAGGVIALAALQVQPDSIYSVQWTAFMIFMVVIGGVGTIEGPLVGAVVFYVLQRTLAHYGATYLVVLGVVAIVVVLAAPRGLWGLATGRRGTTLFPVGYRATFTTQQPIGVAHGDQQADHDR